MANVLPFKKGTQPSEAQQFERAFEERRKLHPHTETGITGDRHVSDVSTGEVVELDMTRKMSAYEIYSRIKKNLDHAKAQAMGEELGVSVEASEPEFKDELDRLIHELAEDIYDALIKNQHSIEVIKPESIGSKTIERLGEKGDANFIVAPGEGPALLQSLQDQDADFRTIRENDFGFVLENEATDFRVVFIYAERLSNAGEPTALEEVRDDETPDEDTDADAASQLRAQQANNQSRHGQGNSLAA